jgi:hypothetical protein
MNRREFLGTSLSTGAALATGPLSVSAQDARDAQAYGSGQTTRQPNLQTNQKKLPIGVFNPPFRKLSLDEMLDKFSSLGVEAVEIGAGGYTEELLASQPNPGEWASTGAGPLRA